MQFSICFWDFLLYKRKILINTIMTAKISLQSCPSYNPIFCIHVEGRNVRLLSYIYTFQIILLLLLLLAHSPNTPPSLRGRQAVVVTKPLAVCSYPAGALRFQPVNIPGSILALLWLS